MVLQPKMASRKRKVFVIILLLAVSTHCEETPTKEEDLTESESKDPSKVEIIKQIKRVNDDGSYTFGYEAEDGTFKIESRDVLGNVKGTFGFVDSDGEIKRVSYSSTSGNNETATATTTEKEKSSSSVIQHIPRPNRNNTMVSTTRKPLAFVSTTPSTSSVVQSIPRRRVLVSSNSSSSTTTSTTTKPSYKNIVKATDFDITTIKTSSTVETPLAQQAKPSGHYIRSTYAPISNPHRYIEGQLIRPTQPATVTTHPVEVYPHRIIATRNPFLEDRIPTIKPISEDPITESPRANLLRRQLSQEKVFETRQLRQDSHIQQTGRLVQVEDTPEGTKIINYSGIPRRGSDNPHFDAREHMIHLQQSIGDDTTDVYSASLTTGSPRPLFTTTERPFPYARLVKYASYQQKPAKGNQETTTDSTTVDNSYVQPVLQVANPEQLVRPRHPFHAGAILIPVNQSPVGSFVVDDQQEDIVQHFAPNQQYIQRERQVLPVPFLVPKRRPIPLDYQPVQHRYLPKPIPVSVPINAMKLQDEIDNIKPPVSTRDFQRLLNRLILRQSQLQEISRLEHLRMLQKSQDLYNPVTPTPVSVFVRTRPDVKSNNGPIQFVEQSTNTRNGHFIAIPQSQPLQVQKLVEAQPEYDAYTNENYPRTPRYRSGRRSARLHPSSVSSNENDNYLPPDVREMLLLRMLQLAINPNLPLPPNEGDEMTTAIRQSQKEAVRNVQILGEEPEEDNKSTRTRNKRFPPEPNQFDY